MKSRLPILKNSTLHVYWFRNINIDPKRINEDKYDGVLINLPIVEFIPKMVIFLNGLNSDFAFFATPRRLFQPPRLLERWEYLSMKKQFSGKIDNLVCKITMR